MVSGMEFIANNFKAVVESGKATGGGRFALIMMGLMAPFTPHICEELWQKCGAKEKTPPVTGPVV